MERNLLCGEDVQGLLKVEGGAGTSRKNLSLLALSQGQGSGGPMLKEFVIPDAVKAITTKIKRKPRPMTGQIDSKPHTEDLPAEETGAFLSMSIKDVSVYCQLTYTQYPALNQNV